jgi:hypothetical protein
MKAVIRRAPPLAAYCCTRLSRLVFDVFTRFDTYFIFLLAFSIIYSEFS